MAKILIVEDDDDLRDVIKGYLKKEGYEILEADNGSDGIHLAKEENPDLIILDIMLPQVDGIEVCRNIRMYSESPIITISAKNSDYDKIMALGTGADDYVTKPFSMVELVARVRSHLRRFTSFKGKSEAVKETPKETKEERVFGRLCIEPKAYRVTVEGKEIRFTSKEFQLLEYLSRHPSIVYTKEQLMNDVWGEAEYIDENTIAVYIARIREKLVKEDVNVIKTVWGVGYKWDV